MKRAVLLTAVALITAMAWARTLPAASSEQSAQVIHKPFGGASLGPAVVVRGFRPGRPAGVSSDIGGAQHWSATIRGVPTSLDFGTTVTVGGGTETGPVKTLSSLEMRELRLPAAARTKRINSLSRSLRSFDRRPTVSRSGTARPECSRSMV